MIVRDINRGNHFINPSSDGPDGFLPLIAKVDDGSPRLGLLAVTRPDAVPPVTVTFSDRPGQNCAWLVSVPQDGGLIVPNGQFLMTLEGVKRKDPYWDSILRALHTAEDAGPGWILFIRTMRELTKKLTTKWLQGSGSETLPCVRGRQIELQPLGPRPLRSLPFAPSASSDLMTGLISTV